MYTSRPVGEMVRIGLSLKLSDLPSTDLGVDQVAPWSVDLEKTTPGW